MGCCASIEQVLGPPFDKMSRSVTARLVCRIQSPTTEINDARRSVFERLANVTLSNAAASADSNTSIT